MNGLANAAVGTLAVAVGQTAIAWLTAMASWLNATPSDRACAAAVLGGLGLWMLLPGGRLAWQVAGGLLSLLAAGLLFSLTPALELGLLPVLFWSLAGVAVAAAVATITARSPVYSAIWFALTLLATGGLFLLQGAQFLGVATVAVYAGAIVVTFLFVLMLAQPEGHTFYDRISWGRLPSLLGCWAGSVLAAGLVWAVTQAELPQQRTAGDARPQAATVTESPPAAQRTQRLLQPDHVAGLGRELFSRQLLAVQIAGALLLAALVGAVAMAAHHTENAPRASLPQPAPGTGATGEGGRR